MYKVLGADQRQYGPVDAEQIQQWIRERRLNDQSLVQSGEADPWRPLSEFQEFQEALAQEASVPTHSLPPVGPPDIAYSPRINTMAVLGLIMGLIAVSLGCCCCYGMPFNILGIIFSAIGLSQIHQDPERETGKALAVSGLVLSLLSFVLGILTTLLGLVLNHEQILREFRP